MILIVSGMLWYGIDLFLTLLPLATEAIANPNRTPQPLSTEIAV